MILTKTCDPGRVGRKKFPHPLDKSPYVWYNTDTKREKEPTTMKKNKKKNDRRAFKKEGQELQDYLHFMRRGSRKESGKAYNRQKMKRGDTE